MVRNNLSTIKSKKKPWMFIQGLSLHTMLHKFLLTE